MTMDAPETWRSHSFHAMGCTIAVWLDAGWGAAAVDADEAFAAAEALFATNEQLLSRFRPDSELSQLNRAGAGWHPVSSTLWTMTVRARQLAQETGGRFDPTLLPALLAAGYGADFAALNGQGMAAERRRQIVAAGRNWPSIRRGRRCACRKAAGSISAAWPRA